MNIHLKISWYKNIDNILTLMNNKTDFISFCHMAQSWTQDMENWSAWVFGLEYVDIKCPKCHNFRLVIHTLLNKYVRFFQLEMDIIDFPVWTLHYTDYRMDFKVDHTCWRSQLRQDYIQVFWISVQSFPAYCAAAPRSPKPPSVQTLTLLESLTWHLPFAQTSNPWYPQEVPSNTFSDRRIGCSFPTGEQNKAHGFSTCRVDKKKWTKVDP